MLHRNNHGWCYVHPPSTTTLPAHPILSPNPLLYKHVPRQEHPSCIASLSVTSSPLPPPRPKYLRRRPAPPLLVRILQVDSMPALDVHRQRMILPLVLPRPPRQMHVRHALAPRTLDVEAEPHVLCAPLVRLLGRREVPVARQPAPRGFSVGADFCAGAEQALALGVGADGGGGAVEVCGFGGGGEDVGEEEVGYAALFRMLDQPGVGREGRRTVMATPTRTMDRFMDCWTVREAFSPGERSLQRTAPVSLVTVTERRGGGGGGVELCVACAGLVIENAARAVGFRGMHKGRFVTGRRSWIASVGLYIAAIAMLQNWSDFGRMR